MSVALSLKSLEGAIDCLDESPGNGETQSPASRQRVGGLKEFIEDTGQHFNRKARSLVSHPNDKGRILRFSGQGNGFVGGSVDADG